MLACWLYNKELRNHWQNARSQAYFRDFRYSKDPKMRTDELVFNLDKMASSSYTYIDMGLASDVPRHLSALYGDARKNGFDRWVSDERVLDRIRNILTGQVQLEDKEDIDLLCNTVRNINNKQCVLHVYAGKIEKEQWTLATIVECGVYLGLFRWTKRLYV